VLISSFALSFSFEPSGATALISCRFLVSGKGVPVFVISFASAEAVLTSTCIVVFSTVAHPKGERKIKPAIER
jgi:hypothetical protein